MCDQYEIEPGRVVSRFFISAAANEGLGALRRAIAQASLDADARRGQPLADVRFDPVPPDAEPMAPEASNDVPAHPHEA